jgi:tetratricopeptide (TPR) repeat protein
MLGQFADTEDAHISNFTSWSCALAAGAVPDFSLPITLAQRSVELDSDNVVFHLNTLGAVLYRAGQFDEALAQLNEAELQQRDPSRAGTHSPAYTWYFLAMTHDRLGHRDEAHKWYEKAAAWTNKILAATNEDGTVIPSVPSNRRLTLELLQSEVSDMLAITAEPTTAETSNTTNE